MGRMEVFPTPVGVFLWYNVTFARGLSLPHTRGGVSRSHLDAHVTAGSSPHPWGCFLCQHHPESGCWVFPTPVGVFPDPASGGFIDRSLPHTRGGVSLAGKCQSAAGKSSPHPWGCFSSLRAAPSEKNVFPTPVGVFLRMEWIIPESCCLPHTRGGVSVSWDSALNKPKSSPHPWGCFSGSMNAQEGCYGLPHTRGGVSDTEGKLTSTKLSSPHPWGCFSGGAIVGKVWYVFPTPVGVFPWSSRLGQEMGRLPHTRGGVSVPALPGATSSPSSPHPWGCFQLRLVLAQPCQVFPTPVGVFLMRHPDWQLRISLPHTRGGVSFAALSAAITSWSSPHPWGCFCSIS